MHKIVPSLLSRHALSLAIAAALSMSLASAHAAESNHQVADGADLIIPHGRIETISDYAHAMKVTAAGSSIGAAFQTMAQHRGASVLAAGVVAGPGQIIEVIDQDITMISDGDVAVVADGTGAAVNFVEGAITTTGVGSDGVRVGRFGDTSGAGMVAITDSQIVVSGSNSMGLNAFGADAVGTLTGSSIVTHGMWGTGIQVLAGASVSLVDSSVETDGYGAGGASVFSGGSFEASNSIVRTTGNFSRGLTVGGGGSSAFISGSKIGTAGNNSDGLWVTTSSELDVDGATIQTSGDQSFGVNIDTLAQASIHNSTVLTSGNRSIGISSSARAAMDLQQVEVITTGDNSSGLNAAGIYISCIGCSVPDDPTLWRGSLTGRQVDVETTGIGSHGAAAGGADVALAHSRLRTKGDAANGVNLGGSTTFEMIDSVIETTGANSAAVFASFGSNEVDAVSLTNTLVNAVQSTAFVAEGSSLQLSLSNGSQAVGGNGILLAAKADDFGFGSSNVSLSADEGVGLWGDIVADATSTVEVSLSNNTYWAGAAQNVGSLTLSSSRWDMSGNSRVGELKLDNGIVAFIPPTIGDYKTLTVTGDFVSNGGTLLMNTVLGDDHSATDKLHVLGDTAGQAYVAVNNVGGTGAQTVNGIQIIEVDGASNAAFNLSGRAVGGLYEYFLFKGGKTDPNDGDWYLRSELPPIVVPPDPCESDPNAPGCIVDPIEPVDPPPHVLRPEAGIYLTNQSVAVGMFQHAMHDRLGEPNWAERLKDDDMLGSVWARVTRNQIDYDVGEGQVDVSSDSSLLQIGSDIARWGQTSRGQIGVMAATGQASSTATSALTGYAAKGKVDGVALGVYGNWFARPTEAVGTYIDAWLQAGRYTNTVHGEGLVEERYDAQTLTGSVEIGYAWKVFANEARAFYLEPQTQFIYTDYHSDDHMEANGTLVSALQGGGLTTRVGLRAYGQAIGTEGNLVQPFVAANWYHQSKINSVAFDGEALEGGTPKDRYELKVGAQLQLGGGWNGWGHLSGQSGNDGYRDIGGQAGLKYSW